MSDSRRLLRALLRSDQGLFLQRAFRTLEPGRTYEDNWHIQHMLWQLSRVEAGEIRRLIICVPPRSMKSLTVSVTWPAWLLGREPSRRIMCLSHTRELVRTHALAFRTLTEAPWYQELFPGLQGRRRRDLEFRTSQHGFRMASAMNGGVLGKGADLIIMDDPMPGEAVYSEVVRRHYNEVYDSVVSTRLNNKETGAIVMIMQRLHADDLVGHVLEQEPWEVTSIPAIALEPKVYRIGPLPNHVYRRKAGDLLQPSRQGQASLDTQRRVMGSLSFSAQYQQEPVPPDGAVIKRDWLRYYDEAPAAFDLVIVSWDTATTLSQNSDWSVGTVWGLKGTDFYLLDLVRGRHEVPDLRRLMIDLHERHHANTTVIEDTELGRAMLHEMRRAQVLRPILHRPRYEKEARLLAQSPKFEAGQVLLPRQSPWLGSYLQELLGFPNAAHDDQVDSTSQALDWLGRRAAALRAAQHHHRVREAQNQMLARQLRRGRAPPVHPDLR